MKTFVFLSLMAHLGGAVVLSFAIPMESRKPEKPILVDLVESSVVEPEKSRTVCLPPVRIARKVVTVQPEPAVIERIVPVSPSPAMTGSAAASSPAPRPVSSTAVAMAWKGAPAGSGHGSSAAASPMPGYGSAGSGSNAAVLTSRQVVSSSVVGSESTGRGTSRAAMENARDAYQRQIRELIERRKHYPPVARKLGMKGIVRVGFKVMRDGTLAEIVVNGSSTYPLLDQAARKAVADMGKLPLLPAEMAGNEHRFEVPIVFSLS